MPENHPIQRRVAHEGKLSQVDRPDIWPVTSGRAYLPSRPTGATLSSLHLHVWPLPTSQASHLCPEGVTGDDEAA